MTTEGESKGYCVATLREHRFETEDLVLPDLYTRRTRLNGSQGPTCWKPWRNWASSWANARLFRDWDRSEKNWTCKSGAMDKDRAVTDTSNGPAVEQCDQCGFIWDHVSYSEVAARVATSTGEVRRIVMPPDRPTGWSERAATRVAPKTWSPLEYLCHIRDVDRKSVV